MCLFSFFKVGGVDPEISHLASQFGLRPLGETVSHMNICRDVGRPADSCRCRLTLISAATKESANTAPRQFWPAGEIVRALP